MGLEKVESFLKADWKCPCNSQRMRSLWVMFNAYAREHLKGQEMIRVKGTASEQLGLYVLMRYFCFAVVVPLARRNHVDLTSEIKAYEAWCEVIDYIMLLKRGTLARQRLGSCCHDWRTQSTRR